MLHVICWVLWPCNRTSRGSNLNIRFLKKMCTVEFLILVQFIYFINRNMLIIINKSKPMYSLLFINWFCKLVVVIMLWLAFCSAADNAFLDCRENDRVFPCYYFVAAICLFFFFNFFSSYRNTRDIIDIVVWFIFLNTHDDTVTGNVRIIWRHI